MSYFCFFGIFCIIVLVSMVVGMFVFVGCVMLLLIFMILSCLFELGVLGGQLFVLLSVECKCYDEIDQQVLCEQNSVMVVEVVVCVWVYYLLLFVMVYGGYYGGWGNCWGMGVSYGYLGWWW